MSRTGNFGLEHGSTSETEVLPSNDFKISSSRITPYMTRESLSKVEDPSVIINSVTVPYHSIHSPRPHPVTVEDLSLIPTICRAFHTCPGVSHPNGTKRVLKVYRMTCKYINFSSVEQIFIGSDLR